MAKFEAEPHDKAAPTAGPATLPYGADRIRFLTWGLDEPLEPPNERAAETPPIATRTLDK